MRAAIRAVWIALALLPWALLTAALGGCAGVTLPADPSSMTADQLRELVKDKNANIACIVAHTPYGKGHASLVVLDKGIIPKGLITVDDACKVTISNQEATP